jgi:hypothetical protein
MRRGMMQLLGYSHIRNLSLAAVLSVFAQGALAQVTDIYPTTTSITSTADRMISYRNQQHSWQTSDGAVHVMVNQGSLPTGNSLALYSSFDGGATWNQMFALANTDAFSVSDGMLAVVNGTTTLFLVYATAQTTGTILYTSAAYNSASQSWTLSPATQTAFSAPNMLASNPAFAADSAGNYWCAYTVENLTSQTYQEMMSYRPVKSTAWTLTSLVFGGPDTGLQHSARPVSYNNGIAMIYESGQTMYWAYRLNGSAINAPWVTSTLYTNLPPYAEDPYDTHYSIIADAANDLHLAFVANQQLLYMRYLSSTGAWGPARPLTANTINAAYPQVILADGNVLIMVNNQQSIEVQQSTNNGNTFTLTQVLMHAQPPPGSSLYYGNPRVEAPGRSTSPIPTFQQFVNGPIQGLMFFQVPVIN